MFLRQSLRFSARGARIRGGSRRLVVVRAKAYSPGHVISNTFHRESPSTAHFSTAITDDDSPATVESEIDRQLVEESEQDEEIDNNELQQELTKENSDDIQNLAEGYKGVSISKVDEEDADKSDLDASVIEDDDDNLDATTDRLISLLESYSNGSEGAAVKLAEFDEAFEAWAALAAKRDGGIDAAETAFQLLEALERNMVRLAPENTFMAWNVAWYNNVMHAYAVCHGGRTAAEKAEEILNKMILACQEYDPTSATLAPPEPTTRSFNIAINAWAKSGEPDSGSHAEEIITRMEHWHLECKEKSHFNGAAVANARTMSGVMDAWAQSGVEGAEDRALGILMYAVERQRASVQAMRDGEPPLEGIVVKPNVIMFNSAIHAWVNSKRGQVGAEQAEGILRIMEKLAESDDLGELDESDSDDLGLKPNTRTLSLVIDAWAQCENSEKTGEAAQRAQDILDMMEKLHREGRDVKPSCVSFTSCIAAWSRSERHPDAAERAEDLLDRLLNLYKETGDKDFKPTVSSGNAVISAFAKSQRSDSIERARAVFERMKDFCEPDSYSYNSVINAFAKKGEGLMAKTLLAEMEDACNSGNAAACPDLATYNTVIYAMSKSTREGSAQDAEALLNKLKSLYEQGRTDLKPSLETYTTVIAALGRLRQAEKANEILRSVVDAYRAGDESLKPDVKMYTSAINACARCRMKYTEQKRKVLKMAIQLFEELKNTPEFDNPNNVTYRALMKACNQLSVDPDERSRLLKAIFQQAAQDGMVCKLVLAILHEGVTPEEYRSIAGENDYPRSWSKNVPRRDRL